jgi:hypothetical protein
VIVWASLAVFGAVVGIVVAAILLAAAAFIRSAKWKVLAIIQAVFMSLVGLCLIEEPLPPFDVPRKAAGRAALILPFVGICLLGLLMVRIEPPFEASRLDTCVENLKRIGLALRNYETASGQLPPAAVADKHGNGMHSWRTFILPHLDRSELYDAYDFCEPWNGPKNHKVTSTFLYIFCCPDDPSMSRRTVTSYLAVTGPGTVWDEHRSQGTVPRIMVVEAIDSGVRWAEPRDISVDEACRGVGSGLGISSRHMASGGFIFRDEVAGANAMFSDGSVWFIPAGLPPATLRGLFTGEQDAWKAWETLQPVHHHRRINWTNCTALAVLVLSYGVLLFRRRDRLPPQPTGAEGIAA